MNKKFIILPILALMAAWLPAQNPCSGVPTTLTVANQNITSATDYKAHKQITVGPAVNITQAVNVTFRAQQSITFTPDFTMVPGATLEATLGDPCDSPNAELYPWVDRDGGGDGESFPWVNTPEYNPWLEGEESGDNGRVSGYPWVDKGTPKGSGDEDDITPDYNPWLDGDNGKTGSFPWVDQPEASPWLDDPEYDPWAEGGRLAAFPNPFVDETKLSFRLNRPEMVTVQIFRLSGELVAPLFKGKVGAGETVTLSFSGAKLPAGLYLARLTTEAGYSASQRLMLQR